MSDSSSNFSEADRELIRLLKILQRDHDACALEKIIDLSWQNVFRLAQSRVPDEDTAEDVTQEVFIVFSQKYSTIRNPESIRSWLYKLTIATASDCRPDPRQTIVEHDVLQAL